MARSGTAESPRDLSRLPSVDAVLGATSDLSGFSRSAWVCAIRDVLGELRERLRSDGQTDPERLSPAGVAAAAHTRLQTLARPRLRRVVNATGVVLHTNLGRARLADVAVEAAANAAREACNLEFDVERGARGERDDLVEEHLCALTGAEAATVVNNNAAGVILALHTLARGRDVIVSRGELVEIGGSFRIPDIMAASGACMREVGTTNRTHLADYRDAIGPGTALLMKVHASNYRVVGFSAEVGIEGLAGLAASHADLFVVEDLGSGALVDLQAEGLAREPVIGERLRAGADLVLASGDKLLGGPQCGIVAGRRELVERMRRSPLRRALRCDKLTLAALEATLRLYRFGDPVHDVPTLRYLVRPVEELRAVGEAAVVLLGRRLNPSYSFELVPVKAEAGSGCQPEAAIDSLAIAVRSSAASAATVESLFRRADPAVIGRIESDTFLLDLRLIDDPRDLVPNPRPQ